MNKCVLIGRLTGEPEIRRTQSGKSVASYRLAVDRQFKQEGQPEADFLSCVAFGSNADFVSKYLHKGMKIAVEGRIQTGSYNKDDGTKVYTTDIIVEHHEFCEKRSDPGAGSAAKVDYNYSDAARAESISHDANFSEILGGVDEELPF